MTRRCLLLHPLIVKAGLPRKCLPVRLQGGVDALRIIHHCSCTTEPIFQGCWDRSCLLSHSAIYMKVSPAYSQTLSWQDVKY